MLIDMTGCSGAGKTTLARCLVQELKKRGGRVSQQILPKDASRVMSALFQLFWELRALPSFLKRYQRHKKFIHFCLDHVRSYPLSAFQRWFIYKSVYRKLATYCFYDGSKDLCVVDEGIIHTAHILFTHPLLGYKDGDLVRFSQLVPVPDLVVIVEASLPALSQRMAQRSDPPWRFIDEDQKEFFLKETQKIFSELLKCERLQKHVVVVKTDDPLMVDVPRLAEDLVSRGHASPSCP